ncbi:hypothetical protein AB0N31_01640 [Streptomyces sp. NPDC051051]|uniref:hypothetical protein n=1 Tax=Streptomyces sp. NPDC051051 TaxID=3155666 RepID=UPI0034292A6C
MSTAPGITVPVRGSPTTTPDPLKKGRPTVMMSHALDLDVLVITVHADPGADGREGLLAQVSALVEGHMPVFVVMVLDESAATDATVGVVLRVHRLCSRLGLLMSVATHSAPARRLLDEASADNSGIRLIIHARADVAVATATALTTAA